VVMSKLIAYVNTAFGPRNGHGEEKARQVATLVNKDLQKKRGDFRAWRPGPGILGRRAYGEYGKKGRCSAQNWDDQVGNGG